MTTLSAVVTELEPIVEESVSVVIGRQSRAGGPDERKIHLADDAAESFRQLCRDAVQVLRERSIVDYHSDAELAPREVFLLQAEEDLDELVDLSSLAQRAATLPEIAPRDLDVSIQFYAAVVGEKRRVVFVRKTDPQITYRSGGFLAIGQLQLKRLEDPAFSFGPGFDVILSDDWVIVLNQSAFERLFRDIGILEQHVDDWIKGITDHLAMGSASVRALTDVARRDPRTWRKLREIRRRGHLANLDLSEVRKYARKIGIDPDKVVQGGELVFDPRERFSFLHLLNEDLYRGPLTDEPFEAQRKTPTGT